MILALKTQAKRYPDMNTEKKVIRLEPFGPAQTGMLKMQLEPESFQSEIPTQHIHVYYEDETLGLSVGVWDTTSMQETFGPYPGDEFMWVLEGQVSMVDGDGRETLINNWYHRKIHGIRRSESISTSLPFRVTRC